MKCRGPKRNRNRYDSGKGKSLAIEGRTVDHMVASVHGHAARSSEIEGYVPRPKTRVEVWRRQDGVGK